MAKGSGYVLNDHHCFPSKKLPGNINVIIVGGRHMASRLFLAAKVLVGSCLQGVVEW
jgi:hypothetical protein